MNFLEERVDRRIVQLLEDLVREVRSIREIVKPKFPVKGFFTQGDSMLTGTIKGLIPGGSDTFFVTPVDVNGNADALPAGSPVPTITSSDPTTGLAVAGDGLSVVATASASAVVGSSFTLTWNASYTNPQGQQVSITATAAVPILAPPALLPVGGVFSQGAPATDANAQLRKA